MVVLFVLGVGLAIYVPLLILRLLRCPTARSPKPQLADSCSLCFDSLFGRNSGVLVSGKPFWMHVWSLWSCVLGRFKLRSWNERLITKIVREGLS